MLFNEMRHDIFSTSVLLIGLGLGVGLGLGFGFEIHLSRRVMGFKLETLKLKYRRTIFACS